MNQPGQPVLLIAGHPAIDSIGMAGAVQTGARHGKGCLAPTDLEQGGGALAQVGSAIPVPGPLELGALLVR